MPARLTRDSRKGKDIIDDLTIDIDRVALYRGLALEKLDHYVCHLPFKADER